MTPHQQSFDNHIALLTEKGYLESNFKTPAQLGEWLLEFQHALTNAAEQAGLNDGSSTFVMALQGTFNQGLDNVHFHFQYRYFQDTDQFSLLSLRTFMSKGDPVFAHAKIRKNYRPAHPSALPSPAEVYARLTANDLQAQNVPFNIRVYRDQQKERNKDNDPPSDRKKDPYNDAKDPFEYDPGVEVCRWNADQFPQFVRKPKEEFDPDKGIKVGLPAHLARLLHQPPPPKPLTIRNIRR